MVAHYGSITLVGGNIHENNNDDLCLIALAVAFLIPEDE